MIINTSGIALIVSALVSMFGIAPITYMALDNVIPYEYDVANSYISPSKIRAGELITTHWKLSRVNRSCTGQITRVIVDTVNGVRTVYDPVPAIAIGPNDEVFERTFVLPRGILPGPKTFHVEALFACNLLQRWFPLFERQPSLTFEVLP